MNQPLKLLAAKYHNNDLKQAKCFAALSGYNLCICHYESLLQLFIQWQCETNDYSCLDACLMSVGERFPVWEAKSRT